MVKKKTVISEKEILERLIEAKEWFSKIENLRKDLVELLISEGNMQYNIGYLLVLGVISEDDLEIIDFTNEFVKKYIHFLVESYKASLAEINPYELANYLDFLYKFEELEELKEEFEKFIVSDSLIKIMTQSKFGNLFSELLLSQFLGKKTEFTNEFSEGYPSNQEYSFSEKYTFEFKKFVPELRKKVYKQKVDGVATALGYQLSFKVENWEEKIPKAIDLIEKILNKEGKILDHAKGLCLLFENRELDIFSQDKDQEVITDFFNEMDLLVSESIMQSSSIRPDIDLYKDALELFGIINPATIRDVFFQKITDIDNLDQEFLYSDREFSVAQLFSSLFEYRLDANEIRIGKELYSEINSLVLNYCNWLKIKEYSKLKPGVSVTYSFSLGEKNVTDITFGNDSGCCLGIYDGELGNGENIPYYLSDNGINIFEIHHQIGSRKKKRSGIVLTFDGFNNLGKKILICNSIELSSSTTAGLEIENIVKYVERGLADFAKKRGYDSVIMSSHIFNTSFNYSSNKGKMLPYVGITKLGNNDTKHSFYNEVGFKKNDNDEHFKILARNGFYEIRSR